MADEQADDYDVELEEPVIDSAVPTTWQEFAEDAHTGQSAVVVSDFGSVTHPGSARLIE